MSGKWIRLAFAGLVVAGFLSSAPALASVIGSWNVTGTMKTKVSIKGQQGDKQSGTSDDYFQFLDDGTFQMTDMQGTWTQNGAKFTITLDTAQIESYFEQQFTNQGLNTDVTVQAVSLKGKETGDSSAINGTFNLTISINFLDYGVPGKAKANYKWTGTPATTAAARTPATEASPAGFLSGAAHDIRAIAPLPR